MSNPPPTPPSPHPASTPHNTPASTSGLSLPGLLTPLRAGSRVRITQQVPRRQGHLKTAVEGSVVRYEQSKTGSWYAHGKDDKLWLDRLVLRRDDGEIVYLNLDQYSVVETV